MQGFVNFKKTDRRAKAPYLGSPDSAGHDLFAFLTEDDGETCQDGVMYVIEPHTTRMIPTGIKLSIPRGYCGLVYARSGLAARSGLRPANCVGVIDSDYRGEIIVALHNDTDTPQTIKSGDRIAQIVITPYLTVQYKEVDKLSSTDRGSGGFGSTGM